MKGYKIVSDEEASSIENKIFPVYNDTNIYITKQNIQNMLKRGGIEEDISDLSLWQSVFVHNSYCINNEDILKNEKFYGILNEDDRIKNPEIMPLHEDSSERMEWLGDGILQAIIAHYLYHRFPDQPEGFLSPLRSKLVKTESLSKLALALKFDKFLIISKHIEIICYGRKNNEILEDAFEAFMGAIMEDFGKNDYKKGFDYCYRFAITLMERYIDITNMIIYNENYKDILMHYFQKTFRGKLPRYELVKILSVKNEENGIITKRFHMRVFNLENRIIGNGIHKSKRDAEQLAAKEALTFYNISTETFS